MLLGRFCFMTRNKYVTFPDKTENISSAKILHTPWSMSCYSWVTAYILTILSNKGKIVIIVEEMMALNEPYEDVEDQGIPFQLATSEFCYPWRVQLLTKKQNLCLGLSNEHSMPRLFRGNSPLASFWKEKPEKTLIEFCSCFRPEPDPDPRMLLQGGDLQDIKEPNVVLVFGW